MIREGALVRHRYKLWTGVVVRIEDAMGGDDPIYHVIYTDGQRGIHFSEEIHLISRHTLQSK